MDSYNKKIDVLARSLKMEFKEVKEDQAKLESLKEMLPRINRLENGAKSDLLAVTTKMSDLIKITK